MTPPPPFHFSKKSSNLVVGSFPKKDEDDSDSEFEDAKRSNCLTIALKTVSAEVYLTSRARTAASVQH